MFLLVFEVLKYYNSTAVSHKSRHPTFFSVSLLFHDMTNLIDESQNNL